MKKTVLFFFPHNPYPPKSGAHKHGCLEIISGLREIGCEITLGSSTLFSETEWTDSSIAALEKGWVKKVRVYHAVPADFRVSAGIKRFYGIFGKATPVNSMFYSPPGLRRWFERAVDDLSPDIVVINYSYWDGLLNHRRYRSITRVIETHDLITLNLKMWDVLSKHLPAPPLESSMIEDWILDENFFEKRGLSADPKEFRIFDKYDFTMTVSEREESLIMRNTRKTRTLLTPITLEPVYVDNSYSGNAVFPTGPNPFNVQGYFYFVKKVLPYIIRRESSFRLDVTGHWCSHIKPEGNVMLLGFVNDMKELYGTARFLVCPIFGGTGQQVKIVEAMSHGVPVVALKFSAEGSPIEHGVNGFVAATAEEFAEYVLLLWSDRRLCSRLGQEARRTIAERFSRRQLVDRLSVLTR